MNRREFLKSMLIMAGAACLGLINPVVRMAKVTVTDPEGKVMVWRYRPVQMIGGCGGMFYAHKLLDANPSWKNCSISSLCQSQRLINCRLERPLVRLFAERWA